MTIQTGEEMWADYAFNVIRKCKAEAFGSVAVEGSLERNVFRLIFLSRDVAENNDILDLLGRWRKENEHGFLGSFPVSRERTYRWYHAHLMEKPDRLLFIIETAGNYVGHVGLFRFDPASRTCEIDNIVRGEKTMPGIMGQAILAMMKWGKETLRIEGYTLKVLGDNERAIKLYKKIGYEETGRIPLIQLDGKDGPEWTEAPAGWTGESERFYSVMTFKGDL